jgi:hypothetical protein
MRMRWQKPSVMREHVVAPFSGVQHIPLFEQAMLDAHPHIPGGVQPSETLQCTPSHRGVHETGRHAPIEHVCALGHVVTAPH